MKHIAITMFNADKRHYGLGEFEYNLGAGLYRRARELTGEGIRKCGAHVYRRVVCR